MDSWHNGCGISHLSSLGGSRKDHASGCFSVAHSVLSVPFDSLMLLDVPQSGLQITCSNAKGSFLGARHNSMKQEQSVRAQTSQVQPLVCQCINLNEVALQRAEMRMVRWMCNVKVKDRVPSKELRERLGIDDIILIVQQNRLQWYGHVLRKEDTD